MASFVLKVYDSRGGNYRETVNVACLEEFTFAQLREAVHVQVPDADLFLLTWEDVDKEYFMLKNDKHLKEAMNSLHLMQDGKLALKIHLVCVPQCDENRFVDVKVELLDDSAAGANASSNQNGPVQPEAANKSLVDLPILEVKTEPLDESSGHAIDDGGSERSLSNDYLAESLISAKHQSRTAKKAVEMQRKQASVESCEQEPATRSMRKRHVADCIGAAAKAQTDLEKEREEKRSRRSEKISDPRKDKKREEEKAVVRSSVGTPGGSWPKPQIFIARGNPGQPQKIMISNVPKGTVVTKESIERLLGYLREQHILPQDAVQMAAIEQPAQPQSVAFAKTNLLSAAASPQAGSMFVPGAIVPLPNGKHFVMRDRDGRVILLEKDAASGDLRSVCKIGKEFQERFGINRLLASAGVAGGSLGQATPQLVSAAIGAVSSTNVNAAVTLAASIHSTAAPPDHCFGALAVSSEAIRRQCDGTGAAAALGNVSQVCDTVAAEVSSVQKEWRKQVSQDLRINLVSKLVKVFFPHPDLAKVQDESVRRAVFAYSQKEEKEAFEKADNRDEYYRLIAERFTNSRSCKRVWNSNKSNTTEWIEVYPSPLPDVLRKCASENIRSCKNTHIPPSTKASRFALL